VADEFEFDDMREIDAELARAFGGIRAPAGLSSALMNRVRLPRPTRLPEVLDAIACMSVLSFAACFAFFVILK
jgi:hypothetical protein